MTKPKSLAKDKNRENPARTDNTKHTNSNQEKAQSHKRHYDGGLGRVLVTLWSSVVIVLVLKNAQPCVQRVFVGIYDMGMFCCGSCALKVRCLEEVKNSPVDCLLVHIYRVSRIERLRAFSIIQHRQFTVYFLSSSEQHRGVVEEVVSCSVCVFVWCCC